MSASTQDSRTVMKWEGVAGAKHRFTVQQVPGSAHWSIMKDVFDRETEEWRRVWATESRTKPDFAEVEE